MDTAGFNFVNLNLESTTLVNTILVSPNSKLIRNHKIAENLNGPETKKR